MIGVSRREKYIFFVYPRAVFDKAKADYIKLIEGHRLWLLVPRRKAFKNFRPATQVHDSRGDLSFVEGGTHVSFSKMREEIEKQTFLNRRLHHQSTAALSSNLHRTRAPVTKQPQLSEKLWQQILSDVSNYRTDLGVWTTEGLIFIKAIVGRRITSGARNQKIPLTNWSRPQRQDRPNLDMRIDWA